MLALIDFDNPVLWAVLIGWILSVILHEFAHGFVAYLGGDYTIRERGGLSLNPIQYIDPVMSLILPAIFLLLGGVPLPGGSTYIRRDLLRNKGWQAAVSLAGPAMNFLLFFVCALPLHPKFGWVNYASIAKQTSDPTTAQQFLAAMAFLQMIAVLMNLVPIPPLDGFQALSPFMDEKSRTTLSTPPISTFLFIGYFMVLWNVPEVMLRMMEIVTKLLLAMGFHGRGVYFFLDSYEQAFRQ